MNTAVKYLVERAAEPSTWRGIIMLITGIFGWNISPEIATSTISAGVAISGLIGAIVPDDGVVGATEDDKAAK